MLLHSSRSRRLSVDSPAATSPYRARAPLPVDGRPGRGGPRRGDVARWARSSSAWRRAVRLSARPERSLDSSVTLASAADFLDRRPGAGAGRVLLHDQMPVPERRNLGQMGDDQHLILLAEGGESVPNGYGRFATDAGVDLVKDERGGATGSLPPPGQQEPDGQHGPGQLPPGRHFAEREQRLSGIGTEQPADGLAGPIWTDLHLKAGLRHRQLAEDRLDRRREPASGRSARLPQPGLSFAQRRLGGPQVRLEQAGAFVVRLQLGHPLSGPARGTL